MSVHETDPGASPTTARIVGVALFQFVFSLAIWGGLLFGSAGTLRWGRGWLHVAVWVVTLAVNLLVLLRTNPAIIAARTRRQRLVELYDKILMALVLPAVLALPVVAGLDAVRYGWARLPAWAVAPGLLLHAAGDAVMLWAMSVNPYATKAIRIQKENGHRTITAGPYRRVRHPMYASVILIFLSFPLVLGSAWTFIPALAVAVLIIIRTAFEDGTLRRALPGYADYASRTRYRLVPGVW